MFHSALMDLMVTILAMSMKILLNGAANVSRDINAPDIGGFVGLTIGSVDHRFLR